MDVFKQKSVEIVGIRQYTCLYRKQINVPINQVVDCCLDQHTLALYSL